MKVRDLREHGEPFDPAFPEGGEYEGGPNYGPHDGSWPFLFHNPRQELIIGPYTWFHKDMLEHHPDPNLEPEYLNEVGTSRFGWAGRVEPNGRFNWYGKPRNQSDPDPNAIEQLFRNHLGLPDPPGDDDYDEEDWTTSHVAASNLTIQELDTGHGDPFDPVWGLRRPFIVKDDVIYMGDPGTHHPWIAKMIGSDMYYNDDSWPGFVWTQPSPDAYEGWFAWHKEPPEPLSTDVKNLIAETFPNYVWGPGDGGPAPEDMDWEEDWDADEDEPYGVLSSTFLDTEVDDYYQQVAKQAERYLAEGEPLSEAIDVAFGMVELPRNYPGDPGSDPTPDEIAHVKSMMGKPNQPARANQDLEHIYKPFGRDSNWYNWRVPVNYYPDSGQVVTGDPGDFHGDLHLPHGGRALTGMIGIQGAEGPQGEQYTPGFTWLDQKPSPQEHQNVIKAISPHWPEAVHKFQRGEPEYEEDMDWGDMEVPLNTRWDDNSFRLGFDQAYGTDLTEN